MMMAMGNKWCSRTRNIASIYTNKFIGNDIASSNKRSWMYPHCKQLIISQRFDIASSIVGNTEHQQSIYQTTYLDSLYHNTKQTCTKCISLMQMPLHMHRIYYHWTWWWWWFACCFGYYYGCLHRCWMKRWKSDVDRPAVLMTAEDLLKTEDYCIKVVIPFIVWRIKRY